MGNQWMMMLVYLVSISYVGTKWVEAQVHHVVGDDRGWDVANDVTSWASHRNFLVGDFLWFAYSAGLGKDNVVELRSKEEYESCDVNSPIKIYTDGLDNIHLQEAGIRYFASGNPENCKKGLKLPVKVRSKSTAVIQSSPSPMQVVLAQEPTAPSSSSKICGPILMIIGGVIFSYVAL